MLVCMLLALTPPKPIEIKLFEPGVISTEEFESHPEFSLDGNTMYLVKSNKDFSYWTIYVSKKLGGKWSKPKTAPFSGKFRDADPFITPNGKRMFFISDRPDKKGGKARGNMDVWYMDLTAKGWGEPVHMGPEVNTGGDEWFPTTTKDGTLYFGSPRKGGHGGIDIWTSKKGAAKYEEAQNAGPVINGSDSEIEPFIAPNGSYIIFNAVGHNLGFGALDFYISKHTKTGWLPPVLLPEPINSKATELSPKVSRDGKTFFFTTLRKKGKGLGDIWTVPMSSILSL